MLWLYRIMRIVQILLLSLLIAALLSGSTLLVKGATDQARLYTRPYEFDYFDWTANALGVKIAQVALDTPFYFSLSTRHQMMVDYFHLIDQIQTDENRLNLIYADPSVHDPKAASVDLRAELAGLYARQSQLAPMAEAILQEQVSAVIADLSLATGGQPIPPVWFHITPLPYNLVVSPRNKIQEDVSISLLPDLSVDRQADIENQVDKGLDVSSLVVPIGGIATYPTMVEQTTALDWLASTVAHEWTHNWLTLRPLGLNYDSSPEARTMNETTADISGGEIGALVLKRDYPELAAEYQDTSISLPAGPVGPGGLPRPPFDFRAEMHTTRVRTDELLVQGNIAGAEAYMEERRQVFWDNGYPIRKLNQAYFAFYGAYADVPGGAAGEDPVGPAVRALRAQSKSLADFLNTISKMSTFQQLQAALAK
jgi:hypothetical protein